MTCFHRFTLETIQSGIDPPDHFRSSNRKYYTRHFRIAMRHILKKEGGYVDNKADIGGKTNWGITSKNAELYGWHRSLKLLSREFAYDFYWQEYWKRYRIYQIYEFDKKLGIRMFDAIINMSAKPLNKFLQQAISNMSLSRGYPVIVTDGIIGSKTIGALNKLQEDKKALLLSIESFQTIHYHNRVVKKPDQAEFIRGWLNRILR